MQIVPLASGVFERAIQEIRKVPPSPSGEYRVAAEVSVGPREMLKRFEFVVDPIEVGIIVSDQNAVDIGFQGTLSSVHPCPKTSFRREADCAKQILSC
jgi:hypothetical protein